MFGIWPGVHSDTRTPQDVVPVTMLLPPAVLHNPSKPLAPPSKNESAWHSTNSGPAANPSAGRLCRPAVGRHTSCLDSSGSPHHIARKQVLSGDGPGCTHGRSQSFWPRRKRAFALQQRSGALAQPPASGFVPTPVGPRPQRPRLRALVPVLASPIAYVARQSHNCRELRTQISTIAKRVYKIRSDVGILYHVLHYFLSPGDLAVLY